MLPRSQRLSGDQVRSLMAGKSAVLHTRFFMIRYVSQKNNNLPARCAVIVSKKVARYAVVRNLLRRRIYGILQKIKLPSGTDYVFSVKTNGSFTEYTQDLQSFFQRL